jgi:hypothetical protein
MSDPKIPKGWDALTPNQKVKAIACNPQTIHHRIQYALVVVAFIYAIGAATFTNYSGQIISLPIYLGAIVFAFHQWLEVRRENSIDKYFDRLELVNKRLDNWPNARAMVAHLWGEQANRDIHEKRFFAEKGGSREGAAAIQHIVQK